MNAPLAKLVRRGRKPSFVSQYLAKNSNVKVCNCATCGKLLLSPDHIGDMSNDIKNGIDVKILPPILGGRSKGRPYCSTCLVVARTANEPGPLSAVGAA